MFTHSAKYAIKAVLYLALYSDASKKIMAKEISSEIDVPNAYMAKLLQALVRRDIISSTRGPKGGFYLSEENRKLPLIRIIETFEGEEQFKSCVLGLKACDEARPCPLHDKISPYRWSLLTALEFNSIEDFAQSLRSNEAYLPK